LLNKSNFKQKRWKHESIYVKKIDVYSSQQREKLLGLAKKIYETKNDERAKQLIKTIANAYSTEKDGNGATLTVFLDDRNPIMRTLAQRAYALTSHGKNKIWDYHAPVIQPVLRKDLRSLEELERFKSGQDKPKKTYNIIFDKPKKDRIEIETSRLDINISSEKYRDTLNIEPRKKISDKYEEIQPIKEYKKLFIADKKTPKTSFLDIQILDVFDTLRIREKLNAENLEISDYFSQVGKKHDSLKEWLSGFNTTFGL